MLFILEIILVSSIPYSSNDQFSTSNFKQPTEDEGEYKVLCLNCIGQDFFKNVSFHEDSFIRNSEIRRLFAGNKQKFESELLFDLNFSEDVLTTDQRVLQALLHKTRMNIQTLHSSSRENTTFVTRNNFFVLRKQVTTFLYQLRQLIVSERMHYDLIEQDFNLISTYLNQLNALPIAKVLHSLYNEKGNEVLNDYLFPCCVLHCE